MPLNTIGEREDELRDKNAELRAENARLKAALPQHTYVACAKCSAGVRHSYAVAIEDGHAVLCAECAAGEIRSLTEAWVRAEMLLVEASMRRNRVNELKTRKDELVRKNANLRDENARLKQELHDAKTAFAACLPSRELAEEEKTAAGEIPDDAFAPLTLRSAADILRSLAPLHPTIERFVRHCEDNGVLAELDAREKGARGEAAERRFRDNAAKVAAYYEARGIQVPDLTDEQLLAAIDEIRDEVP